MARIDLGGNYILRGIDNPVEGNDAVNLDSLRTQLSKQLLLLVLTEWTA